MEGKLKICMLLPFPKYSNNMRITPQIGVCSYLSNFGHKVEWVIWSDSDQDVLPFQLKLINIHVTPQIKYISTPFLIGKLINRIFSIINRSNYVINMFKRGDYNLIIARDNMFDGIIALLIKKKYNLPFVFILSNPLELELDGYKLEPKRPMLFHYLISRSIVFIANQLLHEADLIMPISKWLKEELAEQGFLESKILALPDGVDLEVFKGVNHKDIKEKYNLNGLKVIVYVGTLGKPRCLKVLVQAFSIVLMRRKDVSLLIIGEGSDQENLKEMVKNLKIDKNVIFTGQVPQYEVPKFIAAADIGISPIAPYSFYKMSSPIKMFEYMAMAKPVIANEEIPEHKEVLEQSGGGILVQFSPETFANAIIELLDNPKRAVEIGQKGQNWIMRNRTYELMARQVEDRLSNLIST